MILQGFIDNQGDAWSWFRSTLERSVREALAEQELGHAGVRRLLADLNRLYVTQPALHECDSEPRGFTWVVSNDEHNSVFAWLRWNAMGEPLLIAANMTPIPREHYRLGVPRPGGWKEIFNSDAECYGGSNLGNLGRLTADDSPLHGQTASLAMTLPPLAVVIFQPGEPE